MSRPFWQRCWQRLRGVIAPLPTITDTLWLPTLRHYPFLAHLGLAEQAKLRVLATLFLRDKEFQGVHGLEVTDRMAVEIAAQACLPLLHWGQPEDALGWYDDFVGIVLHPAPARAHRQAVDAAGVVHHYRQVLAGEAMSGGPIMLSWPDVRHSRVGSNVVIHEFVHKLDMRNGPVDGCPPLPAGFMGTHSARAAHECWWAAWEPAYAHFQEQVSLAERFGHPWPWLDVYGATDPAEFFAVVCEAYFVQRQRCSAEFPTLMPLLDAFFGPEAGAQL
jgi:MtfA peptidase